MTNQPVHTTVSAPTTTGVRSPLAVWSLVLGILSRRREPEGRTMALVGIISSAVMLVGTLIALAVGLAVVGGAGVIALLPGTTA